jgi:hypothetical protein
VELSAGGEINDEDTEDTEEEIAKLLNDLTEDIDAALGEDNFGLKEVASLLLKVRGLIAKVSFNH